MAVPRRSAPTRTALAVLAVLGATAVLGAGTGSAGATEPTGRGTHRAASATDPYAGAGLLLRLPDGRQVRLIRPDRPRPPVAPPGGEPGTAQPAQPYPQPSSPASNPAPGPVAETGAPTASAPTSSDPAGQPDAALSEFPVPVVQPLFPGGPAGGGADTGAESAADRPGSGTGTGSGAAGAWGSARGSIDGAAGAGAAGAGAAAARAAARASAAAEAEADAAAEAALPQPPASEPDQVWPSAPAGPPPLDPRALAGPQTAILALPPVGPNGYSGTLRHRLLPLGVGLALIGAGAALLGWRLCRL